MTPERWQQVKALCELALEREPGDRSECVARSCGGDEELRHDVEALLAQATSSDGVLDAAVWRRPGPAATMTATRGTGDVERWIPRTIGRYRVLRLVGEGGMGVVYEAEQDHPRRLVALKVIKPGLASAELLRRFERESQALGRLQHPGIGQIYEAGTADTGFGSQPYFAMEFIVGEGLKEYTISHRRSTQQRLELIAKICDAVQHAHERGLIHRDLKPGNILVDRMGQPKILDFGVARLTDGPGRATRQTDAGQLIGTLAYMSPEQVLADPMEVDARSDVYALGVIMYEVLAGRLPYSVSHRVHEAVRTIREEDPTRLSSVRRAYRGDIETIVAKALEKDRSRRYSTAAALASDIRKYLADEPIQARPASTAYQLQKFARRHRPLVTATVAVFATLVVGIAMSTRAALKAREAEQAAQAVIDFLRNDLLAQASASTQAGPGTKPDPDLKVRTALDRAAARIAGKFDRQPEVEAVIRDTIGQTYIDLGLYTEARTQFDRALDLHLRVLGTDDPQTLRTSARVARVALLQGAYPEAESLFVRDLEQQRRSLGPGHPDTLYSASNLTNVYFAQGKYVQAETLGSQTLEICRRVRGAEHPDTLAAMNSLANVYNAQSKYEQAEALDRQALESRRRVLGSEHPDTLVSMNNLAGDYTNMGKHGQAAALHNQALEIQRRVLGPEHRETLMSMGNLARAYTQLGQYAQAEELSARTLEGQRRVLSPDDPHTLISMDTLAAIRGFRGKFELADTLFNQVVESSRRILGPEHPYTLIFLADFATILQRQGRYALAATYAAQALDARRRALGSEHADTMVSAADLALAYQSQGRFTESEPLAREALQFNRREQPNEWERFRVESVLGASLAGQKRHAEAEPLLLEGYRGMAERKDRVGAPYSYYLDRAGEWVVQLYQSWGKPDQASEWRRLTADSARSTKS
jgi:tetratricopeptide (TPR) repeat protein